MTYIDIKDYFTEREKRNILIKNIQYNLKKGYHSPNGKLVLKRNLRALKKKGAVHND